MGIEPSSDDADQPTGHQPVLLSDVLSLLAPAEGETFVDATVGLGGHAAELAPRLGPTGRLVALDQDPTALEVAKTRALGCPVVWRQANFRDVGFVLEELGIANVDGLLADLGVSSPQLDVAERGFSFRREGPLDMRMDPERGPAAADLVAQLSERELADLFFRYGEERNSRRLARAVVAARRQEPIRTTTQLAELIRRHQRRGQHGIDPATRVFQALRIAVNDELAALEELLAWLPRIVRPGGRAAIISFHSLEDRLVKQAFAQRDLWERVTRKPVVASDSERDSNPRSRSAKLRVALRTNTDV